MAGNSVQLKVSLGLQQALAQVENLRKLMQQSVKPDSSAYREIENELKRTVKQVEILKRGMNDAFKTSTGTKQFTKQLEKTLDSLDLATEHLAKARGKDLIFSAQDEQKIKNINTEITNLRDKLKTIRTGKVNNFFDNDTVAGFKNVREIIRQLKLDTDKISFQTLKDNLIKELKSIDDQVDTSKEKLDNFEKVINNVNLTDGSKLQKIIKDKLSNSITQVFDEEQSDEAIKSLNSLYANVKYAGTRGDVGTKQRIKKGTNPQDIIKNETEAVRASYDEEIKTITEKKNQLEEAFNKLTEISGSTKKGQTKQYKLGIINELQGVFNTIGFNEKLPEKGMPNDFIKHAKEAIQQELSKLIDPETLEEAKKELIDKLQHVFDGVEKSEVVTDASIVKKVIKRALIGEGVDLKDSDVDALFDGIKKNADIDDILNTVTQAISNYIKKLQEAKSEEEDNNKTLKEQKQSIEDNVEVVNDAIKKREQEAETIEGNIQEKEREKQVIEDNARAEHESSVNKDKDLERNRQGYKGLKEELEQYSAAQMKVEQKQRTLDSIKTAIVNWMGFTQVLNITKRAIQEALNHIKQLDTTMNGIAIVTDMTTAELWKQVDAYSAMAQKFGVTIQGAYEVSKIYYQAGYDTNEVLTLTNETLKLAKISGLDYATTTDYMMTAMRGFKLEMEDASRVVDVYSNLAANTAVSQQELAEAMTRTASSMESVGATFEETSAMIATMVAVTRESANNIGSAMKSIASRYGELTKDPTALFDAEGEAMSFNKVDTALKSVGITLQTTDHQFRDFTDVIIELAEKWDTLDSASQRYIATQFAGNRQQSRFLALVSNIELLRENLANAEGSEDVGTLQALKALDSLESKINQVQVAYQQFYTTIGIENVWKGLLDSTRSVIDTLNGLPKLFNVVPLNAIAMVSTIINTIKTFLLNGVAKVLAQVKLLINQETETLKTQASQKGREIAEAGVKGAEGKLEESKGTLSKGLKGLFSDKEKITSIISGLSSVAVMFGAIADKSSEAGRQLSGMATTVGGLGQTAVGVIQAMYSPNKISAIMNIATGVLNVINGISIGYETTAEKLERLTKEAENLSNEAKKSKAEYNTLKNSVKKIDELNKKRYDSIEATEEYHDAVNELADSFPQLVMGFDDAGNAILDVKDAELLLIQIREKAAKAAYDSAIGEKKAAEVALEDSINVFSEKITESLEDFGVKGTLKEGQKIGLSSEFQDYNTFIRQVIDQSDNNFLRQLWNDRGNRDYSDILLQNADKIREYADEDPEKIRLGAYGEEFVLKVLSYLEQNTGVLVDTSSDEQDAILSKIVELSKLPPSDSSINSRLEEIQKDVRDYIDKNGYDDFIKKLTDGEDNLLNQVISGISDIQEKQLNLSLTDRKMALAGVSFYNNKNWSDNSVLNNLAANVAQTDENEYNSDYEKYNTAIDKVDEWFKLVGLTAEQINNIFDHLNDYQKEDIFRLLKVDSTNPIYDGLNQYLDTLLSDATININKKIEEADLKTAFKDEFGSQLELSVITEAANLIIQTEQQGLDENAENIREAANALLDLFKEGNINLPIDDYNSVLQIFKSGFSTKEDINKAIEAIKNLNLGEYGDNLVNVLIEISDNLITNYYTSLTAAVEDYSKKYSTDSKTFEKIISGFDIEEFYEFLASPLANSLGLGLDQFKLIDGKYKLSDTDYINNLVSKYEEYVKTAYGLPLGVDEEVLHRLEVGIEKLTDNEKKELGFTGNISEDEERRNQILDAYKIYQQLAEDFYTLFITNSSKKLEEETKKHYADLISTYLSGKKDLSNYEDIFSGQIDDVNEELIKEWAKQAGYTLEETNNAVLEYIKNKNKQAVDSQKVLKDVQFISDTIAYASEETLNELANLFGYSVEELFDINSYSAIFGGYQINKDKLQELLKNIENSETILADSIIEYLSSINKLFSEGLGGKLTYEGKNKLTEKFGPLTFTETAEGLKLSQESAIALYNEINKIDKQQGKVAFDALVKNLEETNEHFKETSDLLTHIADLQAKIEDKNKYSDERIKQYDQELALAKQIVAIRAGTEDSSLKFMDLSIPGGMNNPINYWNSVEKAYSSINQAKTDGYIAVQDYYNIINEMANLVAQSNGELEWMGMTSENASLRAAELIEEGMNALTIVDGKGVQISLANLGNYFQIGADDMATGMEKGFKVMAKEQIAALDAQINFLEAIVALQQLDDIAGPDGIFDFDEIFFGEGFNPKYLAVLNETADALKQIEVEGTNLYEVLTNYETAMDYFKTSDNYIAFLNSLRELWSSGDWDPSMVQTTFENFINSINNGEPIEIGITANTEQAEQQVKELLDDFDINSQATPPTDLNNRILLENNVTSVKLVYSKDTPEGLKELTEAKEISVNRQMDVDVQPSPESIIVQIEGEIDKYFNGTGEEADPNHLVNSLMACVSSIEDISKWTPSQQLGLTNLVAKVGQITKGSLDPVAQLKMDAMEAIVTGVNDESGLTPEEQLKLNNLLAKVNEIQNDGESPEKQLALIELLAEVASITYSGDPKKKDDIVKDLNATANLYKENVTVPQDVELPTTADMTGFDTEAQNWAKTHPLTLETSFVEPTKNIPDEFREKLRNKEGTSDLGPTYDEVNKKLEEGVDLTEALNGGLEAAADRTAKGLAQWPPKPTESQKTPQVVEPSKDTDSELTDISSKLDDIYSNSSLAKEVAESELNQLKDIYDELIVKYVSEGNKAPENEDELQKFWNWVNEALQDNAQATTSAADANKLAANKTNAAASNAATASEKFRLAAERVGSVLNQLDTVSLWFPRVRPTASKAKGNMALANGTLMGELGEELYVTNGHYYIAGAYGPEFVNLPDDAIVFNHLQTRSLLQNGRSSSHGTPVTNERRAVARAAGTPQGPAMASAQSVLNTLKNIRAMWQAMLDASLKDLGQQAGSGGGGKGGGGGKDENTIDPGFIADLERWYNLLRQIDKLERDINYEENLRSKQQSDLVKNGKAYYESQKRSLEALNQQIAKNQDLSALQKSYYDKRRQDLANSKYGQIFTFNESGLMQYNDQAILPNGDRGGLFALAKINAQNPNGSPVYTAREQYELLKQWGFGDDELKYDSKGDEIKWQDENGKEREEAFTESLEAFWDKVDGWKEELDELYDNYNDVLNDVLDEEVARNNILKEMQDNQLSLEQKLLSAIENREQKIIDELQKEYDALRDAASKYIEGLNQQLNNERNMYQRQQDADDLNKLRRQLAILQRTGGSSIQIRSLQNEIRTKEQDNYFQAQQDQIDAIKDASDKQLAQLEEQLNIMKETLEYQKEHGLLWAEVSQIMENTPNEIMNFLNTWSPELSGLSSLGQESTIQDIKFLVEQWVNRRDDKNEPLESDRANEAGNGWARYAEQIQPEFSKVWTNENVAKAERAYKESYAKDSDPNKAAAAARKVFEESLEDYYRLHPNEDLRRNAVQLSGTGSMVASKGGDGSSGGSAGGGVGSLGRVGTLNITVKKLCTTGGRAGSAVGGNPKCPTSLPVGQTASIDHNCSSGFAKGGFEISDPTKCSISGNTLTALASGTVTITFKYWDRSTASASSVFTSAKNAFTSTSNLVKKLLGYSEGGLADYTGLALVHGTKTRPEAFLDADDTKMWKEDILSGKKGSLTSSLLEFNDLVRGIGDSSVLNNINKDNESIVIEHAEVNMNATIANDYDAKRAGQNALEEMVKIARKSSTQSIRR